MPDFTTLASVLNDIDRQLEFDDTAVYEIRVKGGSWIDVTEGSFIEKVDQRPAGGKKFYRLSVADEEGVRSQILATMSEARINGREYKVVDKDAPLGVTREWLVELQPL